MAIVIWKFVHHHETGGSTVEDEILPISLFKKFRTEEATLLFLLQNVIHPPRSPKKFHRSFLSSQKSTGVVIGIPSEIHRLSDRLEGQFGIEIEIVPPGFWGLLETEAHGQ